MYLVQVLVLAVVAALAHATVTDTRHSRQHVLSSRSGQAKPPFFGHRDWMMMDAEPADDETPTANAPRAVTTPLECFQVAEPILTDQGLTLRGQSQPYADAQPKAACSQVLMVHTFANSYGAPFVGNYTPPDCDFDHVVINFTTLVRGRQFDRTGVMYLGDNEVWRTSTAEPNPSGIRWVWLKDMTPFLALWKQPQTVIFDLENIVNEQYTGLLNTTLTATFFKRSPATTDRAGYPPADQIIPITQRLGAQGKPSQFTVPEMSANNTVTGFPRNARRAVFSVDVKGQGNEEFWWSNVPQSATRTFDRTYGTYPGYSPWREVQVAIDGQLAGVVWPFPVIYTGGVVPQLHRPLVGVDTFDLREHEIDITPFLPRLCDGNSHTFNISVVGLVDDGANEASLSATTESSWYVTGKVFVWLDEDAQSVTTGGEIEQVARSEPSVVFAQTITQNATGFNQTLDFALTVARRFSVRASVKTQKGEGTATWSQTLDYSNVGRVFDYGNGEVNTFSITGLEQAESDGVVGYATNYSYPLFCNQTQVTSAEGNLTLTAALNQGLGLEVSGEAVFPTGLEAFASTSEFQGSRLQSSQNGTAVYHRAADNSFSTGNGQTEQSFSLSGIAGQAGSGVAGTLLYSRRVGAANDSVSADEEEVVGTAAAASLG
ncbi:peptide-n4-(n-acetyl-beta-glucosaminyl)asparagine amidase a protein [Apiospora rasikravindrae]|uniref:Peptide-n4-(N-acetyl-beta-glucosaminyl)asparagine amidase a protein n=1 Tax=Apiospora rasikravindrae TaxID=990691 RepID=A0ABR1TEK9_9PEZI